MPLEAIANARTEADTASRNWAGYCLMFVRTTLGVGRRYNSAIEAWNAAKVKHRNDDNPPAGVPVFWRIGKFGHIALSDGDGYVWSTDIKRRGKVDRVKLSYVHERWGADYLGWTEDVNDKRVYTPTPAWSPKDGFPGVEAFKLGKSHPAVKVMGEMLKAAGYDRFNDGNNGYNPGPKFTSFDMANMRDFQRRYCGDTRDNANGIPGPRQWSRLVEAAKAKGWTS